MKSLGISITRDQLSAFLWEQSLFSSKRELACSVRCNDPYGGPGDIARLAEEIRKGSNGKPIPPVVLSLPPSWTYLRRVKLPVADLPRAKKVHLSELEGNLPVEDEEILSDILPSPPGESGTFLAIAARRTAVEKTVSAFSEAGFRLDRVVTDHVSLLLAALSGKPSFSGFLLSTLNDLTILRVDGGALAWARQFPGEMTEQAEEQVREIASLLPGEEDGTGLSAVLTFGEAPAFLTKTIGLSPFASPVDLNGCSPIAYGAALAPFHAKETGGFSLRTSAETEGEVARGKRRTRIAAAAAATALLALAVSVETSRYAAGQKVSRIKAQIRKEFTEAVPGVTVIVRETAQIREKIQSFSRQQKELGSDFTEPAAMLGKVSAALPKEGKVLVREVSFDSGRLRLAGEAPDGRILETFRTSLADAFGPETAVTVRESEGSARGSSVKFTILIEKGGNGRAS